LFIGCRPSIGHSLRRSVRLSNEWQRWNFATTSQEATGKKKCEAGGRGPRTWLPKDYGINTLPTHTAFIYSVSFWLFPRGRLLNAFFFPVFFCKIFFHHLNQRLC
jgi:hypothetical protein